MRTNLTKKDLVNLIYMQLGFSKLIAQNLIDDFFYTIVENLRLEKKLKLSKFGTLSVKKKILGLDVIQKQKKKKSYPLEM